MATGTVKWFNAEKRVAIIIPDSGGQDLIAYFSATQDELKPLQQGQYVEFDLTLGPKGPQVENIRSL